MNPSELRDRAQEYKQFLKDWIAAKDKMFREEAQTSVARRSRVIRTAEGKNEAKIASWSWFWGDALWCGDVDSFALEEFLGKHGHIGLSCEELDPLREIAESIFNDALKEFLPEIYWRHLAVEIGDEPQTDEQRAWIHKEND